MSSRLLQDVFSVTIFRLPRCLQDQQMFAGKLVCTRTKWTKAWLLGLSNSFSSMYLKRELNISLPKNFPNIDKSETGRWFFMRSFSPFPVNWNSICFFFQRLGKAFLCLQVLNMIEIGFTIFYHIVSTFLWIPYSVHGPW